MMKYLPSLHITYTNAFITGPVVAYISSQTSDILAGVLLNLIAMYILILHIVHATFTDVEVSVFLY